jgi:hypothetical protein
MARVGDLVRGEGSKNSLNFLNSLDSLDATDLADRADGLGLPAQDLAHHSQDHALDLVAHVGGSMDSVAHVAASGESLTDSVAHVVVHWRDSAEQVMNSDLRVVDAVSLGEDLEILDESFAISKDIS